MKDKITKNLGLKIIALLSAVMLWVIVTAVNDPAITQTFYNIPVTLKNTNVLTDANKVYKVLEGTNIIPRVIINAPRSVISDLDESNIIATADVNDLSSLDTISIRLDTSKHSDQINSIHGTIDAVKLDIEEKMEKTFTIFEAVDGEPEEGYIVGDVKLGQNLIKISGPKSVVNSIDMVTAKVDVSGIGHSVNNEINTTGEIILYDTEWNQITNDSLKLSVKSVSMVIEILKYKEVPIRVTVTGPAAPGYRATGAVDLDVDSVIIKGYEEDIDKITEIVIPSDAIDISEQKSNFSTTININDYLPENVACYDNDDYLTVEAVVHIMPETTKKITLSADDIEIINIPEGYKASVSVEEGTAVELVGLTSDLALLDAETIGATLDISTGMLEHNMTEPEEGFFGMPLTFNVPEEVGVTGEVRATLHLQKESAAEEVEGKVEGE